MKNKIISNILKILLDEILHEIIINILRPSYEFFKLIKLVFSFIAILGYPLFILAFFNMDFIANIPIIGDSQYISAVFIIIVFTFLCYFADFCKNFCVTFMIGCRDERAVKWFFDKKNKYNIKFD